MLNKLFLNILKKYRFKLFIFFITLMIYRYLAPLFIMPYLLKIIGDKYAAETLTLVVLLIIVFLYSLLFSSQYLSFVLSWKHILYGGLTRIKADLRVELFSYAIKHSTNYFNNTMAGIVTNKIKNIVEQSHNAIEDFFRVICSATMFIIIIIIYYKINYYMCYFIVCWTAIYLTASYYLVKLVYSSTKKAVEENNKISGLMTDNFMNIMNIKSFSHERKELGELKKHNIKFLRAESRAMWAKTLSNICIFILKVTLMVFMLAMAFILVSKKEISIGTFVFIGQNVVITSFLVNHMFKDATNLITRVSEINDGFNTLLKPIEINDRKTSIELENVNGKIIFKNINFSY